MNLRIENLYYQRIKRKNLFSEALRFCLGFSEALRFCLENCPPETGWTSAAEGVDITLNTAL